MATARAPSYMLVRVRSCACTLRCVNSPPQAACYTWHSYGTSQPLLAPVIPQPAPGLVHNRECSNQMQGLLQPLRCCSPWSEAPLRGDPRVDTSPASCLLHLQPWQQQHPRCYRQPHGCFARPATPAAQARLSLLQPSSTVPPCAALHRKVC